MPTDSPNRRKFLTLATATMGGLALPSFAAAAPNPAKGDASMAPANRANEIFKPEFKFGLGGVPMGNEFNKVMDKDAEATLDAAWTAGVRYFDVAPWYGLGLSERRFGQFLHDKSRGDYLLSSKVGKLLKASKSNRHTDLFPMSNSPNDVVYDYTADGVRRSIEDSLQRLGVDSLDVAFVHDISPDFPYFPTPWEEQFEIAQRGAFPALSKMREEGIIKAWGIGVNRPEPILRAIEVADPDVCLCASQYSLIDHANAVNELFPAVRQKNVALVIGSSLNAGFLSGSPRYNYGPDNYKIPAQHIEKREQLRAAAERHGVDLRSAALQFSAAPDVAAALVVGASSPQQILEDYNSMHAKIPAEFWQDLQASKLIDPGAAVPSA
ncbi:MULTISPECIES: aldo/keto reductase [Rhodomicrobium]|uniref:aldo/keto reductase n=1 Tax=Rhodomicrobium TaxID=1068 RepID=UPI001AECAA05|nr:MULTISPECIES: aldo/keto reductase [Rhodomicrobium]